MGVFGDIFDPTLLENAAQATLRAWMPTYIVDIERQRGLAAGAIPVPRGPEVVTDPESPTLDAGQHALMWLWVGDPEDIDLDDGAYTAAWPLSVRVAAAAATHERTRLVARIYQAAVRTLMVQHGDLGGVATSIRWVGESYSDGPRTRERTEATVTVIFRVQVGPVASVGVGPVAPSVPPQDPTDDLGDLPEVESTDVTVVGAALDAEL